MEFQLENLFKQVLISATVNEFLMSFRIFRQGKCSNGYSETYKCLDIKTNSVKIIAGI